MNYRAYGSYSGGLARSLNHIPAHIKIISFMTEFGVGNCLDLTVIIDLICLQLNYLSDNYSTGDLNINS